MNEEGLRRLLASYRECRALMTAVRLGVFDALGDAGATAAELARRIGVPHAPLTLLLDALAGMELLAKRGARYAAAPESGPLLAAGGPGSLAALARHHARMWDRWSALEERIRGAAALPDPEAELRDFLGAMEVNARRDAARLAGLVDLAGARRLLDLGGGPGTHAAAFARRWPGLEVTLFDHPGTVAAARPFLEAAGAAERVLVRGGDLFTGDVGRGYDAIWASNLLHSYAPPEVRRIVALCRRALAPGGRLLIHDLFLDGDRTRPRAAAVFSLHMLVVTGRGRSYSWDEVETLLAAGGFGGMRRLPATETSGILVATRAPA
jgi:SAM-dependent methyltransferase